MPQYANQFEKFLKDRAPDTLSLSGVKFWINPQEFHYVTEQVRYEEPTLGGYCRWNFGFTPESINFTGFTGVQGVEGIEALKQFRAIPGNQRQRLIALQYPNRFGNQVLMIYLDVLDDYQTSEMHLYFQYSVQGRVYSAQQPSATRRLANSAANDMGILPQPGLAPSSTPGYATPAGSGAPGTYLTS